MAKKFKPFNSEIRKDFYYFLKESSWTKMFCFFAGIFLIINIVFALLYMMGGNSVINSSGSFKDSFYFSIQTISTIGYGAMYPSGDYVNVLVAIESLFGMVYVAILTGLIFAKASRPRPNIIFSNSILINKIDGDYHLVFRVANKRGNELVDAEVNLNALKDHNTLEGQNIRKIYDLNLVRKHTPFFSLSWLVMHKIDKSSPLYENFEKQNFDDLLAITALITGHDGTYSQTVFAKHTYSESDILIDHQFEDVLVDEGGANMFINFDLFHKTKTSI